MSSELERVDLVFPDKIKGWLGSYFPPPEPVPHFTNQKLEEIYSVRKVHIVVNPFAGKKKSRETSRLILSLIHI